MKRWILIVGCLFLSGPVWPGSGSWVQELPVKIKKTRQKPLVTRTAPKPVISSEPPASLPTMPKPIPALDQVILEEAASRTLPPKEALPPTASNRGWYLQGLMGLEFIKPSTRPDDSWAGGLKWGFQGEAEGSTSPWSVEVWVNPRHEVLASFRQISQTTPDGDLYARIRSMAEYQVSAHYQLPHGRQSWIVPEAGFGASLAQTENRATYNSPPTANYTATKTSWSPLLQLGLTFFAHQRISLRVDAAYVSYANTFTAGNTFVDLGYSAWLFRPMMQLRL